ncbi:unnamed protein product, partial [Allacma fusca]
MHENIFPVLCYRSRNCNYTLRCIKFLIVCHDKSAGSEPHSYLGCPDGETVETPCGSIKGIVSKSRDGRDFLEWRGIPFGKAPIGPLRFASPVPFGKWEGVKDGSKFGGRCPEISGSDVNLGDEDCLNLNVSVPKVNSNQLLPVM